MADVRRRRIKDRIFPVVPVSSPFQPDLWAKDAVARLDHARDADMPDDVSNAQRWRLRRQISALASALGEHPDFAAHPVRTDMAVLLLALSTLDEGSVHDVLKARPKGRGNTHEGLLKRQFKVFVIQMCDHLIGSGMEKQDAFVFLAKAITDAGQGALKPPQGDPNAQFAPATVKRWYQSLVPGETTGVEDNALRRRIEKLPLVLPRSSAADAKRDVMAWLALEQVRATFPKSVGTSF